MNIKYGDRYLVVKNKSTTAIAKHIRADIKESIREGALPNGLKVSVRTKYFSGGSSIDVSVTACRVRFLNEVPDPATDSYRNRERYTVAGKSILRVLGGIVGAYNYDGSDPMTDYFNVNFYAHVNFDWELEADAREALYLVAADAEEPKTSQSEK